MADEKKASTPTPTQEENDRARLGEYIKEHADDGSGPDPHIVEAQERAKKDKEKTDKLTKK